MKKLLLVIPALAVASMAAFGQGTVSFDNRTGVGLLPSNVDRWVRFDSSIDAGYGTNGGPVGNLAGAAYRAQLYVGASTASAGSLVAVTAAPAVFRSSTSTGVGTWIGGTRTLDGFNPGDTVNLQVRVWDLNFGSTFETATGGFSGVSAMFSYLVPSATASPDQYLMGNFQSFTITGVPEPTTMALAGLGAAALLIFRRRK